MSSNNLSGIINIYNDIIKTEKVDPEFIRKELTNIGTFIDDKVSLTPLHLAVLTGDIELIKSFCSVSTINSKREEPLFTPLHLAISFGNYNIMKRISIIKLLCCHGANPNSKDKYGESCLFKAYSLSSTQLIVPVLLDLGANPLECFPFAANDMILIDWLKKSNIEKDIKHIVKLKLNRYLEDIQAKIAHL